MASYWEERAAKTQAALTKKSAEEIAEQTKKYYRKTMQTVCGDFEATYLKVYERMRTGQEVTPADLYKLDTYWQMQNQLKTELEKLGDKQAVLFTEHFQKHYQSVYDTLAAKDGLYFNTIDTRGVEAAINEIWCADGKSWSSRIWENTAHLQQTLNQHLIDCVVVGRNPSELKKQLMDDFGASFSRADALVRTELAHIQTKAAQQRYIDAGLEEVEVWADYDERRCDVCGELHKKRFPIHGKMPLPAHPRCRCCIIPVVEVE